MNRLPRAIALTSSRTGVILLGGVSAQEFAENTIRTGDMERDLYLSGWVVEVVALG